MISLRLAAKETTTRPNLPKRQENVPTVSKLVSLRVNDLQENYLDRQGNSYDMMFWTFAIFSFFSLWWKFQIHCSTIWSDVYWLLRYLAWHVTYIMQFMRVTHLSTCLETPSSWTNDGCNITEDSQFTATNLLTKTSNQLFPTILMPVVAYFGLVRFAKKLWMKVLFADLLWEKNNVSSLKQYGS